MTDAQFAKSLFGPGLSTPASDTETARALFGREEPQTPPEPLNQPITGPVIPGQEKQPDYVNKTSTSAFLGNLFNN